MTDTTTLNKLHTPLPLTRVHCGMVYDVGWIPPAAMTYDEWARQGQAFQAMSKLLPYAIGDWLNAGESAFGELYAQAIEWTGNDIETLQQYKWVTSRFPPERRWPPSTGITFTHLRLVAKLPPDEADAWLKLAHAEGLSTRELIDRIKKAPDGKPEPIIIPAKLSKEATVNDAVTWLIATFDKRWLSDLLHELLEEIS